MQDLKISSIQCNQIWEDREGNFISFNELLKEVQSPVDIIVFPEMFQTGYTMNVQNLAETMEGESIRWLKEKANQYNCAITTSLIIKEEEAYYNRMVFVQNDGSVKHYDKQRLFTFSSEDRFFTPGNKRQIIDYRGWKILLQVCYDLRFPQLSKNTVENGNYEYDVMINVANWPAKRGLHWKVLLQARAIENQSYTIGVNRVGENNKGLKYSGDSSLIAADGTIINRINEEEQVINNTLHYDTLKETRKMLPFLKDR